MKRLILIFVLCGLLLPTAYGETISHTFPDGSKYVGEVKGNNMHGQGTYTWADGEKYVGEYKDGKKHGQGTYTYADGNKYVGEWKDDKKHGQGTLAWPSGKKYVGEFKDGDIHGQGTETYADGDKDVGEYRYGVYWRGAQYNASGKVIGEMLDGMPTPTCNGNRKGRFWGTGFAVRPNRVVTNAHVVYCCKKVTVFDLSCSDSKEVTVVATEQNSDLGLLRLDMPLKHYATLRSGKKLQLGEAVSTYDRKPKVNGCPQYDVGQGNVTELNWMPDDSRLMVHDSPTHKGSSGGPVLDALGHIVGVSAKVLRSQHGTGSGAVKPHLLKAFLKSNNVEYKTAPSTEERSLSEIKKKSDNFTVIIKCIR